MEKLRNDNFIEDGEQEIVNPRAEYGAMRENIEYVDELESWRRYELSPEEREQAKERGRKVLEAIRLLPERPNDEEMTEHLRQMRTEAARQGVLDALNERITLKMEERTQIGREIGELSVEEERTVEELRERVIDMTTAPEGILADRFPSGIYLYHGAKVKQVEEILTSGAIMNASELYERRAAERRTELLAEGKSEEEIQEEVKKIFLARNSGQEGISWSVNGIDALPGTRGHIAGFVAAPEDVLGDDKLVIPSRPAPYELLQISDEVKTEEFFEAKTQAEVWGIGEFAFGEKATVDGGLMRLLLRNKRIKEHEADPEKKVDDFYKSLLTEFAERGGARAEKLRSYYEVSDGRVKIDGDLFQQKFDENYLPPAAVWIQAMKDKGMFKDTRYAEMEVPELILEGLENENLVQYMRYWAKQEGGVYDEEYERQFEAVSGVQAGVEEMYFVTSHRDLEAWLRVMARAGRKPKGILLYDDRRVVRENFVQRELGNHDELAREIGRAVSARADFWEAEMGMLVSEIPRAGHMGQVFRDSAVRHDLEVKIVQGEARVEKIV